MQGTRSNEGLELVRLPVVWLFHLCSPVTNNSCVRARFALECHNGTEGLIPEETPAERKMR